MFSFWSTTQSFRAINLKLDTDTCLRSGKIDRFWDHWGITWKVLELSTWNLVQTLDYSLIGPAVSQAFSPASWQPEHIERTFIKWATDERNFCLSDCVICNQHQSLLVVPGLNVCCQLGFAMLNVIVQVGLMREKPSPATAWRDQTMQTCHKPCRRRVI